MVTTTSSDSVHHGPTTSGSFTITGIKNSSVLRCIILLAVFASLWNISVMVNQSSGQSISFEEKSNSDKTISTFGPEGWSAVKLLFYMTTHWPTEHIAFLPCWKDAIERLDIFKYADLMLYTPTEPGKQQLEFLPFRHTIIKLYVNPGYQEGAVQSMTDPFLDNTTTWFDDYDWVIRINFDVLVRSDAWLMKTMLNGSIDMIVHECYSSTNKYSTNPMLHSDFFAFRPKAVDREKLLQVDRYHAESHITNAFRHVYDARRFAYVEGGKNLIDGACRIAGVQSPVLHVHELSDFCPYYYNVTKEGYYR